MIFIIIEKEDEYEIMNNINIEILFIEKENIFEKSFEKGIEFLGVLTTPHPPATVPTINNENIGAIASYAPKFYCV